jgi:Zn finger protein HypA/HybF involved in hydrogenase expression|tara:strand:+ start:107 stop:667 length:561 start_codon:yes stop_codon:yes gene_type:complete
MEEHLENEIKIRRSRLLHFLRDQRPSLRIRIANLICFLMFFVFPNCIGFPTFNSVKAIYNSFYCEKCDDNYLLNDSRYFCPTCDSNITRSIFAAVKSFYDYEDKNKKRFYCEKCDELVCEKDLYTLKQTKIGESGRSYEATIYRHRDCNRDVTKISTILNGRLLMFGISIFSSTIWVFWIWLIRKK